MLLLASMLLVAVRSLVVPPATENTEITISIGQDPSRGAAEQSGQ